MSDTIIKNYDITAKYADILKYDFLIFIRKCLKSLMPDTTYQHNWHIDLIASTLEECMKGETTRLIVNLPPRHLKSLLVSVIFPAWLLGHDPSAKIICASYGQDLAEKHARDCRNIMTTSWYKSLFPGTRLTKNSANEFVTSKNGCRYSVSVGGPIIGRGADYIIIDDPLKPDEALSDTIRKSVNEWYNSNALTRLDNKATGRIIIVMQRLHLNDLVGHVLEQEEWRLLAFPAIATEDETHLIKTKFEEHKIIRLAGEPLHAARESLANYTIDSEATAYLNGNKLFQRHAAVVGSTGSGKSWTTANLILQAASLKNGNAILFDIHNEYTPLQQEGICHFKIAGANDVAQKKGIKDGIIYLPFWLLGYEDIISMLVDRSDNNAPNQAMMVNKLVSEEKEKYLQDSKQNAILESFTIDSPIPYSLQNVINRLKAVNEEMVPGAAGKEKQGEFYGKLARLIARIEARTTDRRFGFMFGNVEETYDLDWLKKLCIQLASTANNCRIKIIDFSEVPSDILPLIVSLVARIVFSIQQWTPAEKRHPISLFCDEAHLYIPDRLQTSVDESSLRGFERIAKEGRKYGVGLVVITQRPSEVSRTVLSQCNNFIAMRLTNAEDQSVIKRLLPDSLGGFGDVLPVLDTGEALVVGDATILPIRVRINEPNQKPNSGTIPFWNEWSKPTVKLQIENAVDSWRLQTLKS